MNFGQSPFLNVLGRGVGEPPHTISILLLPKYFFAEALNVGLHVAEEDARGTNHKDVGAGVLHADGVGEADVSTAGPPFLYWRGVFPNFLLKSTIKCEQSEKPERMHASVTLAPRSSSSAALERRTDSRYSRGDVCK